MGLYMSLRKFIACISILSVSLAGCDTGSPRNLLDDTGAGQDQTVGADLGPQVTDLEGADRPITAGDKLTFVGLNFDPVVENNVVFFEAGPSDDQRVKGLPVSVRRERADDGVNFESELDIVVPGGVRTGSVTLVVGGVCAGSRAYDATPQIYGYTLGITENDNVLRYQPLVGFADGASRVTVYGLNLNEVQDAIVGDEVGNSRRVPSNVFERNPGASSGTPEDPSGLESVGFDLRNQDNSVDIRLPFNSVRGNMRCQLSGTGDDSNNLWLPVTIAQDPEPFNDEIGFVVTSTYVPPGVRTGEVPVYYTCYELGVESHWRMLVEFQAENDEGDGTSGWEVAQSAIFINPEDEVPDPFDGGLRNWGTGEQSAATPQDTGLGITPGTPRHTTSDRLTPGIGARRQFVWDAANDPIFRALNVVDDADTSVSERPRYWRVKFRLTPLSDTENRQTLVPQGIETPWVLYYDVTDRPSNNAQGDRVAEIFESFDTGDNELGAVGCLNTRTDEVLALAQVLHPFSPIDDDNKFTFQAIPAVWGPPVSPGLLQGQVDTPEQIVETERFGTGRGVVVLENVPVDFFGPDVSICSQWIEFDTDRMEIVQRFITDNGTPDPSDDGPFERLIDLTNRCGDQTANPGVDLHEFHFSALTIRPGTEVRAVGGFPLVVRLSGLAEEDECDDPQFDRCPCEGSVISLATCDDPPAPEDSICTGLHIQWDDTLVEQNGLRDDGEYGWLRLDGGAGGYLAFDTPVVGGCTPGSTGVPCVSPP
ncbi:MAG: hypothetical protein AAF517_19980, partial [Planctomycetota bacterium]